MQAFEEASFASMVRMELLEARVGKEVRLPNLTGFASCVYRESGHAKLNSAHEAFSVILEELDEFWEECRKKRAERNPSVMLKELVRIGAMAQRAAEDLELIDGDTIGEDKR